MWADIYKDKPISWETVKLLGVPFTWGGCVTAYKLVPDGEGRYDTLERRVESGSRWVPAKYSEVDLSVILDHPPSSVNCYKIYPVTFKDEPAIILE